MKIYKTIKCTKQVLDSVTCDLCKTECIQMETLEINHLFGYGTEYDMSSLNIDVCEKCLIKLFRSNISTDNRV